MSFSTQVAEQAVHWLMEMQQGPLNEDLGARRVSGSFPSKDPQAVLNALQAVLGFEQHSLLGRMIVLR